MDVQNFTPSYAAIDPFIGRMEARYPDKLVYPPILMGDFNVWSKEEIGLPRFDVAGWSDRWRVTPDEKFERDTIGVLVGQKELFPSSYSVYRMEKILPEGHASRQYFCGTIDTLWSEHCAVFVEISPVAAPGLSLPWRQRGTPEPRALYLTDGNGSTTLDKVEAPPVAVGLFREIIVSLTNWGSKPVTVTGFRIEGDPTGALSSLDFGEPYTIPPRTIDRFRLRFQPTQPGPFEATIVILSDERDYPELPIRFVAQVDPAPFYINPSDEMEFGSVIRGSFKSMDVEIGNNSDTNIEIVPRMQPPDGQFSPSPESSDTHEILPGASEKLQIVYTPTVDGSADAVLVLSITLGNGERVERKIRLHGSAVSPKIVLDPTSLDFGALAPGLSKRLTVNIRNTGNADLTISGVSFRQLGGDWRTFIPDTIQFPIQIGVGQSFQYGVTYTAPLTPSQVDIIIAEFSSNDPDSPKVSLEIRGSSSGVRLVVTDFISFQNPQPTDTRTVEIENLGDAPATIDQITFDNGTVFELKSPPEFPLTVNPGKTEIITIGLKQPLPSDLHVLDFLYLNTNDPQHPKIKVVVELRQ